MHHDETHPEGEIIFLLTQENKTNSWYQSGRNNSYSGIGNSFGVVPNYWGEENFTQNGIVNMSQLSDYELICETFDMDCVFTADTRGRGGPLLWTAGDLEVWRQTHLMEGVTSRGDAEFIMNGFDFNIVNGSLHIQTPRVQLVGFVFGDNVTILNANFNGDVLTPFAQTTSGGGASEWTPVSSISCHDGLCSRALGGTGSPIRGMSASFSSIFLDNMNLTFFITSTMAGSDNFTINANNNVGSGEVTIFTTSTNIVDTTQLVSLPSSMDNKSSVTLTFNFSGNNPIADSVFIDDVLVIGNATATTEANITVQDSDIKFGDGTDGITYQGDEAIGFSIMNITADIINFIGNSTFVNVIENFLNVTTNAEIQGNLDVGGYINASNWLDVSITSNQVTDLNNTINTIVLTNNNSVNNYIVDTNSTQATWVDTLFVRFTELVDQLGNWSADKVNYYTKTESNALNTSQTNYINFNNISVTNAIAAKGDGTVTSVSAGNGLDFTTITNTGPVTMGTPSSLTAGTSNAVTATSHTHAVSGFLESLAGDSTPQLGGYLDTNTQNIGSTSDEIENIYVATDSIIFFGNGQEASITYNGTALVISG